MRRNFLKAIIGLAAFWPFGFLLSASRLRKSRPCDGACCHESPLRPIGDGRECEFHDHTMQFDINSGCRLMAEANLLDGLSKEELRKFAVSCIGYPHLYTSGDWQPGKCCWRRDA